MNIESIFFTILAIVAVVHLIFLVGITVLGFYLWKKLNTLTEKIGVGISAMSLLRGPTKLTWIPLAMSAWNFWRRRRK